jgi:hypothetical protein
VRKCRAKDTGQACGGRDGCCCLRTGAEHHCTKCDLHVPSATHPPGSDSAEPARRPRACASVLRRASFDAACDRRRQTSCVRQWAEWVVTDSARPTRSDQCYTGGADFRHDAHPSKNWWARRATRPPRWKHSARCHHGCGHGRRSCAPGLPTDQKPGARGTKPQAGSILDSKAWSTFKLKELPIIAPNWRSLTCPRQRLWMWTGKP